MGLKTLVGSPHLLLSRHVSTLRHASAVLSNRRQDLTCLKPMWAHQPAALAACLSDLISAPQEGDAQFRLGIMPALHT